MTTDFSRESVKRIAELSRLHLSEDEITQYQKELAKIIQAFNALSQVPLPKELLGDARSALGMAKGIGADDSLSRMCSDEAKNSIATHDFLAQSPDREGVFVRVPAILASST
ncbi:Asp-tRNA(Asn)/Glu-tRNA(Gln) amidotransferase subunit GatC [Fluviispira multicolorata]|uniref:Glutamyl-tRNA(Gln) amidotransferase subunit C n=1 Tax=Fluviispira multicolorata TaxID=2654512 RepID=A0A833JDM9_9BACT|nr:Asp-tRNA(Asn)/Glu-tRNA(Gln) amidotransferase subunit GatC [Fluviispira multicolorata]KAB8031965.1 hypothetical protein GCL57_04780 [Fluviispira multicolorata]